MFPDENCIDHKLITSEMVTKFHCTNKIKYIRIDIYIKNIVFLKVNIIIKLTIRF